ncbi:hypothetical protein NMY22_g19614 [Coprinellus aureogranulatus]|nr:hypothetical protein NMY22_g19614 [Coprinellus aureogranulatus]
MKLEATTIIVRSTSLIHGPQVLHTSSSNQSFANLASPCTLANLSLTSPSISPFLPSPSHPEYMSNDRILERHPPNWVMALEYIGIVRGLRTRTGASAIKGHMFKLLRPALIRHTDLRERLGKARIGERPKNWVPIPMGEGVGKGVWEKARLAAQGKAGPPESLALDTQDIATASDEAKEKPTNSRKAGPSRSKSL